PRSAIRPYPTRYEQNCTLKDGKQLLLRPVRPEDEPLLVRFHEQLSEDSVRMRYLQALPLKTRTAHERLRSLCFIDYNRQIAIVAEQSTASGTLEIVGIARLSRIPNRSAAEVSLLVRDDFQSRGLGRIFLEELVNIADVEGVRFLEAMMYAGNTRMRHIAER